MSHTDVIAAIEAAQRALQDARSAIELQALQEAGEKPIGVKRAAQMYGISERHLRRYAEDGCGIKVGKTWFIYTSRLLMMKPQTTSMISS